MEELPDDNRVVAGALWAEPELAEVSLEVEFARELDVDVGSIIEFDVQGVPLPLHVTSLREVDWQTFGINFFLVVEPGVLEQAPQTRVATMALPAGSEQSLQDAVAAQFPNVTIFRVRELLEKVSAVLRRMAVAVQGLGALAAVTGIIILAGAVSASALRRGRELALLKTLGLKRLQAAAAFAFEYAFVGLTAGIVGTAGGNLLAWAVLTRGMELPWRFDAEASAVAIAAAVLLTATTGVASGWSALARRPIAVLRQG